MELFFSFFAVIVGGGEKSQIIFPTHKEGKLWKGKSVLIERKMTLGLPPLSLCTRLSLQEFNLRGLVVFTSLYGDLCFLMFVGPVGTMDVIPMVNNDSDDIIIVFLTRRSGR